LKQGFDLGLEMRLILFQGQDTAVPGGSRPAGR
jgi:hypothetical protein